jgi:phosphoribosylaminoimidazolecarboxamide formyltransferase/IMP cyclohydrolase
MGKDALSTRNVGNHPQRLILEADKVTDLRYGTNPLQTAALYGCNSFLGTLHELKTGKEGASQTNMEDILYAALTVMYFDTPTAIIMKHENPCGFATQYEPEPLSHTYRKAFGTDFRAAFGGTVFINRPLDMDTANAIRELFEEVIVTPGFDDGVVGSFKGSVRIFEYNPQRLDSIPKYVGDVAEPEVKKMQDGSCIGFDAFLSPIRTLDDLRQHTVKSCREPTEQELRDLLTAYRIRMHSNSVRMVKNGYATALAGGNQDRVGCIEIAYFKNSRMNELAARPDYEKFKERAKDYLLEGSSMASDGFFPFQDSIELANELGITAVLAPAGGKEHEKVIAKAGELGLAFVDLPAEMRFFDHH